MGGARELAGRHVWVDGDLRAADGLHLSSFDRAFQLGDGETETRDPFGFAEQPFQSALDPVFLDPRTERRLPSRRLALDQDRPQPLGGAIHRRREPGRSAADDDQVVEGRLRPRPQPETVGDDGDVRPRQHVSVPAHHDRQPFGCRIHGIREPLGLGIHRRLEVDELVRDVVTREKRSDGVGVRRPACAQDPQPVEGRTILRLPVVEQVVDDRVELFVGRIPGLEQIVIDASVVDRPDRGIGVGVSRQQDAFRLRRRACDFGEQFDAAHPRHPLVRQNEGDRGRPLLQLGEQVERGRAGVGAQHAIPIRVFLSQVAFDGCQQAVADGGSRRR